MSEFFKSIARIVMIWLVGAILYGIGYLGCVVAVYIVKTFHLYGY